VVHEQGRPHFPPGTPAAYQKLAETCWSQGKHQRLEFDEIVRQLQVIQLIIQMLIILIRLMKGFCRLLII
jgi:hypothetical protein